MVSTVCHTLCCPGSWGHLHIGRSLQDAMREQVRKWSILSGGDRAGFLEEETFYLP